MQSKLFKHRLSFFNSFIFNCYHFLSSLIFLIFFTTTPPALSLIFTTSYLSYLFYHFSSCFIFVIFTIYHFSCLFSIMFLSLISRTYLLIFDSDLPIVVSEIIFEHFYQVVMKVVHFLSHKSIKKCTELSLQSNI